MYYKVKATLEVTENDKVKKRQNTYLTTGTNFAEAGYKVIQQISTEAEIEDICLMKNFKPAINEPYADSNKLYVVKIAQDFTQDNGTTKTIKYEIPAFADNSDKLQDLVREYISQGLDDMRLTTISETKWIYIQ